MKRKLWLYKNWQRLKKKKMKKQNSQEQKKDVVLETVKDTESLHDQELPDSMEFLAKEDKKMKGKLKVVKFLYKQEDLPKYDISDFKDQGAEPSSIRETASTVSCDVCMVVFSIEESSKVVCVSNCKHRFCEDCIESYLSKTIREDVTHGLCPESKCNAVLKPDLCRKLIPEQLFDRWKSLLTLGSSFGKRRIECPYLDCEGLFMDDGKGYDVRACPKCWQFICMPCGEVKWHNGFDCETYQEYYGNPFGRQHRFGRRHNPRYGGIHDYRLGGIHDYRHGGIHDYHHFPGNYHDLD